MPRRARTVAVVAVLAALLSVVLFAGSGRSAEPLPLYRADVPLPKIEQVPPPPEPPVVASEVVSRGPELWPVVERDLHIPGPPFNVAEVKVPKIGVYDSPTAPEPRISLSA